MTLSYLVNYDNKRFESLPVVQYPVVVDQILGNIHYVYEDDQLNQKPKST